MYNNRPPFIKIYNGYGHAENLVIWGHVLTTNVATRKLYRNSAWRNMAHVIKLFFSKPLAHVQLQLHWQNKVYKTTTNTNGFFIFEWSTDNIKAGWHTILIDVLSAENNVINTGEGKIYVPHITQLGIVSDIDDTIMVSHSATLFKRLRELFLKNSRTRNIFPGVQEHYMLLANSFTNAETPNPFFYVSSSEWNLYDYLTEFFSFQKLPQGVFMLSEMKQWYQLFKTGKTKHETKVERLQRLFTVYTAQQFILIGDNSQKDMYIYAAIAAQYKNRVHAVLIRNVYKKNEGEALKILNDLNDNGIVSCLFNNSREAIDFSKKIGLIKDV